MVSCFFRSSILSHLNILNWFKLAHIFSTDIVTNVCQVSKAITLNHLKKFLQNPQKFLSVFTFSARIFWRFLFFYSNCKVYGLVKYHRQIQQLWCEMKKSIFCHLNLAIWSLPLINFSISLSIPFLFLIFSV